MGTLSSNPTTPSIINSSNIRFTYRPGTEDDDDIEEDEDNYIPSPKPNIPKGHVNDKKVSLKGRIIPKMQKMLRICQNRIGMQGNAQIFRGHLTKKMKNQKKKRMKIPKKMMPIPSQKNKSQKFK